MPFTAREKIYIPEFLLEVSRCTWIGLVYCTQFSLNYSLKRIISLAQVMCTFHRIHQLLRNLRDSQWNPRTIGKKEHCQQECTTVAFMGTIFIMKAHKKAGLGQYIKRNYPSSDFSVLRPGREVEDKNHAGDLIIFQRALAISLVQLQHFCENSFLGYTK